MPIQGGPAGYPSQSLPKGTYGGRYWPIIGITAVTVGSMFWWMERKAAVEVGTKQPEDVPGFGRKVAEATGMMEGDRAMQGIFPTKKITHALDSKLHTSDKKDGS